MTKLEKAFELACKEVFTYQNCCLWCDDEDSDCDNCKRLQAIKESFLKQAEADDE